MQVESPSRNEALELSQNIWATVNEPPGVQLHGQKCMRLAARCKSVVEVIRERETKNELKQDEIPTFYNSLVQILRDALALVSLFKRASKNKILGKVGFVALDSLFSIGSAKKRFNEINIRLTEWINDLGLVNAPEVRRNLSEERKDDQQDFNTISEYVDEHHKHLQSAIAHLNDEKERISASDVQLLEKQMNELQAAAAKQEEGGEPQADMGEMIQRQAKLLRQLSGPEELVQLSDLPGWSREFLNVNKDGNIVDEKGGQITTTIRAPPPPGGAAGASSSKAAAGGGGGGKGGGVLSSESTKSAEEGGNKSTEEGAIPIKRLLEQPPSVVAGLLNQAHKEAIGRIEKVDLWHRSLQMEAPLPPEEEAVMISRLFVDQCLLNYDEAVPDGFYDAGRDARGMTFEELSMIERKGPTTREVLLVDSTKDAKLKEWVREAQQIADRAGNTLHKIKAITDLVQRKLGVSQGMKGGKADIIKCQEVITDILEKSGSNNNVVMIGELTFGVGRHRALLFKYICDRCDVPARLVRGTLGGQRRAWNVVRYRRLNWVLDLMEAPNRLLREGEELVDGLRRAGQTTGARGRRMLHGAGLTSVPTPDEILEMENLGPMPEPGGAPPAPAGGPAGGGGGGATGGLPNIHAKPQLDQTH